LTKDQNNYDLMHRLQKEGVTAGAVLKQREIFNDPHLKERGYFEEVTHPMTGPIVDGKETPGTHLYPGPQGKLSKTPMSIRTPAPTLGQHNEYVYKDILGLSDAEYQQLLDDQIAGDTYLDTAT
jgi:crotonobetainyl-CoA:carnitine CoA-transferase CaiB-like acyl-CoA transferase